MGVAITILLAELHCTVPGCLCMLNQRFVGTIGMVKRHWCGAQGLVPLGFAIGGAAVVAHDPKHGLSIFGMTWECPKLFGHKGRCLVGNAGHDGRDGTADRTAFFAVIRNAGGHQQTADVGKAEPERAVLV